jgi:hypothetical protein
MFLLFDRCERLLVLDLTKVSLTEHACRPRSWWMKSAWSSRR